MTFEQVEMPLGHVLSALIDHRGRTPKKLGGDFVSSGIPVLSAKNVQDGQLVAQDRIRYVTAEMHERWMPEKLQIGDALLTSEAPLGEMFYLRNEARYCLGQRLFALRPNPDLLNDRFFYYLMRSPEIQYRLHSRATGTTAQGIRQSELVKVVIEFPSLPHQEAIAAILGTLDDKIELNRQMNHTLEAIARALFRSWFVDFDPVRAKANGEQPSGMDADTAALFPDVFVDSELGPIPEGWQVGKLGKLCHKPQYGYTASAQDEMVGPQFLRITDINKQPWIDWPSVPYCEISVEDHRKYRLRPGDILVARIADPGHAVLIEEELDAVFASYLIRFRPVDDRMGRYLQYWQRSTTYWNLVEARKSGTTRSNLNAKVLASFPVLIPPLPLCDRFSRQVTPLRDKVVANSRESRTLAELRDTLLPKLISGELRLPEVE